MKLQQHNRKSKKIFAKNLQQPIKTFFECKQHFGERRPEDEENVCLENRT